MKNRDSSEILTDFGGKYNFPTLVCKFNYANEYDIDFKNSNINYSPLFIRLNSKVVAYDLDIKEILGLVNKNLSKNAITLSIYNLNVYFVVHPDRMKSYEELIKIGFNPVECYKYSFVYGKVNVFILTYETFFNKYVDGKSNDGSYDFAHRDFINL